MSDETTQRLRDELARLDAAIAGLAGMPEAQSALRQQRAAKAAELARLEGRAPEGGIHIDQSGQSGGVSFGAFNQFNDVRPGGGNQAILNPEGATGPAATSPGSNTQTQRRQIDDRTLSADGVHFSYGHALIIGVSAYASPQLTVPSGTTANDAHTLGELLRDPQLAAYPASQVRVLGDAQATRAAVLDALEDLAQRAAGGTALIFFAGHGEPAGGSYALLPYDAEPARLAETGIDAALFHRQVAKVRERARRLVVLLNCCHAGGVGDEVLDTAHTALLGESPPAEFYRPLAAGSGQVVISSSRPEQKSGARSGADPRYTPFGAQLLAALRGAVPGSGPALGVFELFAALRAAVPADARHIWYRGGPLVQEPLFYASRLDDNLPVALRPGWQGGTLSGDTLSRARRLAELELQVELAGAGPALLAERDELLRALGVG